MTLVSQLSFRDMYHRGCFFAMNDYLAELLEAAKIGADGADGADGALGYGYIDNEAGFTFEILASAKREGDRFIPLPNDGTVSLKVRRGSAAHWNIILHPDVDTTPFEETIRFINEGYFKNEGLEFFRGMDVIDELRHPDFPDDLRVLFMKEGQEGVEICWVRSMDVAGDHVIGKPLNEPYKDFGVHEGDTIPFGIVKDGEDYVCVYIGEE